jgi:hypothetical protein
LAHPRRLLALASLAWGLGFASLRAADPEPADTTPLSGLGELLDRIPDFSGLNLPSFLPKGVFRVYSSPHFGDLLHRDYLRVPVGVRAKLSTQIEAHVEVEGYFTHGLKDTAGYGFDSLRTGVKFETPKPTTASAAYSTGVDFTTPLSRPPVELSDGHRHTVPYVATSFIIAPDSHLLGYGSFGADLLNRTALPANFGRNELHSNSLVVSAGVAREWPKFRATLTATLGSTALISDEHHQVFGLRPALVLPITRFQGRHTRLTATIGGWSIWGPDGHELGVSTSMKVEFQYHPGDVKR